MHKKNIKQYTLPELKKEFTAMNEAAYRAQQVYGWLFKKGVRRFDEMTDVSFGLREKLEHQYMIPSITVVKHQHSSDGVEKYLFGFYDGAQIETVYIPSRYRGTLCMSTQVGCRFSCAFCASGANGFVRNLTATEIVDQILFVKHQLGKPLTNYVLMGTGEPLDNYEQVTHALHCMNDPKGMGIAARRITLSTVGIIPGIERLKHLGLEINLSLSLHATTQEVRRGIMPAGNAYTLDKMIKACAHYYECTRRIITIEYVMLKGINDTPADAARLLAIARILKAKVNLIPYSSTKHCTFSCSTQDTFDMFLIKLSPLGDKVSVRWSKGKDIDAACGQLAIINDQYMGEH